MLNISPHDIEVVKDKYESLKQIDIKCTSNLLLKFLIGISFVGFILLFMPWTQNIQSKGYVTTLHPDQRPQTIHSIIAGRIENWFVREGDFVHKGDTILFISEIKDEYFDPDLLSRTEDQIKTKELAVNSYMEKVRAIDGQIDALLKTKKLKIEQANNYMHQAHLKIQSDSIYYEVAVTNYQIVLDQYNRAKELYNDGLKSLTDLESRKLKMREALAKKNDAENKLLTSRNALINAKVELSSIENQYIDKLAKSESNKYAALSAMYDAEATVTKMQNQYMNYSIRTGLYYITAPQDGYVTKAIRSGIGETIKEGEDIVSIMPSDYDLAVAMYVRPMDIPLIKQGQPVRFVFDGWPNVVFSGWPGVSYGTYGGEVVAIDNNISENGKYRILVAPAKDDNPWPAVLRVGSGANGMALLQNVPIWYELWRNLNGFPPDYYEGPKKDKKEKK